MSINLGQYNTLRIKRYVDFGAYLSDDEGNEVLLPKRYLPEYTNIDDPIEVFIYNDSEDRMIATTESPICTVGTFALLRVSGVNQVGAFLDWGLPKDLLVPFREQKVRMREGRSYIVYVYVDDETNRIVASAKLDKFLDNIPPQYTEQQEVSILITQHTELGYKVIVNDTHWGMIYHDEIFTELNIGEVHTATVKKVRDDDKIDLILGKKAKARTGDLASVIIEYLQSHHGSMSITDKSSPELIRATFECSKKDFKKAVGNLYKKRQIIINPTDGTITLA